MTEIRKAERGDLATVASWLCNSSDCELWAGHRVTYPVDLSALPGKIEWADSDAWVVTQSGKVSAFGQVVAKPLGRFHLARLIVAPDQRAKGIGRTLSFHLLQSALALGPAVVSLNVAADNHAAIGLYQSIGFAEATRPPDEPSSVSLFMTHVG